MKIKLFVPFILICSLLSGCDFTPPAQETYELSEKGFFSASLSKSFSLTGDIGGFAQLWTLQPKKLIYTWQHNKENSNILYTAIADNEQYALTAETNSIAWWKISDGSLLNLWHLNDIKSIAISSNGKSALIGLSDRAVYFSLSLGKALYILPHESSVTHLNISKSNLLAVTGSLDHTAKLWDLTTGELKHSWPHDTNLSSVLISPNDAYVLTNEHLGTIRLWKPRTGKLYRKLGPKLITLSSVAFSNDSRQIIAGQVSRRIDLWDIPNGQLITYWRPKKERKWSPSAATIIALGFTKGNEFWSIASNGYLQHWAIE